MPNFPRGILLCIRATACAFVCSWLFVVFLISWPEHPMELSMTHPTMQSYVASYRTRFLPKESVYYSNPTSATSSNRTQKPFRMFLPKRQGYSSLAEMGYYWRPRVIHQAVILASEKVDDHTDSLPTYNNFITRRIDPYLLSYTSGTVPRIRLHNNTHHNSTDSKRLPIYKREIFDSTANKKSENPLLHSIQSKVPLSEESIYNSSDNHSNNLVDLLSDAKCEVVPKHAAWMLTSFPTCNLIHELDIPHSLMIEKTEIKWRGYWRDVWSAPDTTTHNYLVRKIAMKTLRFRHEYNERNYDRHRKDALASERLTSSPSIVNMYGFCGNSGLYQYSSDGTLGDRLAEHIMAVMESENRSSLGRVSGDDSTARQLGPYEKLRIAHQISLSLADLHDVDAMRDKMGRITSAAIVHTDIKPDQYINFDGSYKLTDFNRCRFMRRKIVNIQSNGDGEPCGFIVDRNPSAFRAPEEYAYDEETEKVDIYAMGNIFYTLLADREPWDGFEETVAQRMIMKGMRPDIPDAKNKSEEFVDVTLRELMVQCFQQDPQSRPRARIVADILSTKISSYQNKSDEETGKS